MVMLMMVENKAFRREIQFDLTLTARWKGDPAETSLQSMVIIALLIFADFSE